MLLMNKHVHPASNYCIFNFQEQEAWSMLGRMERWPCFVKLLGKRVVREMEATGFLVVEIAPLEQRQRGG